MASAPGRSDTVLVTSFAYDTAGSVKDVTDPRGLVLRTTYDAAGRKVLEVQNYVNGVPSSTTADDDYAVGYAYTSGLLTKRWVDADGDGVADAGEDTTQYTYGVTTSDNPGASKFASNERLRAAIYPEQVSLQSTGDRDQIFAYNALGEQIYKQDQTGTVLERDYDTAGRRTAERATTLGTDIDGAVRRIVWAYDAHENVTTVTQYDATSGGSVANEVKQTFNEWNLLSKYEQDDDSAVGSGGSPNDWEVGYTYAKAAGGTNVVRLTEETRGVGSTTKQTISYEYLSSSGGTTLDDDDASRVTTIKVGSGSPVLVAEYRYLGSGLVVDTDYPQPDLFARRHDGASTPAYTGLDQFNRAAQDRIVKDLATDRTIYSVDYAYDRNSNLIRSVDNILVDTSGNHLFDMKYTYDGRDRLSAARQGRWDGSDITNANRKREEQWTLTLAGNWDRYQLDRNGDGDTADTSLGERDERGTFSQANELKTRDINNDSAIDKTLSYNLRGDTTSDGDRDFSYDAWGRLVKIEVAGSATVLAEYGYNGLGHLVTEHIDTDGDGDVDGSDAKFHRAYNERWQWIGVVVDGDDDFKRMMFFHRAGFAGRGGSSYIDAVLRVDTDADTAYTATSDAALEQSLYPMGNFRSDVSLVVTSDGSRVREYVKYSAYGEPFLIAATDLDCDGDSDGTDTTLISDMWANGHDRGDYNLDGATNSSDGSAFLTDWTATPSGGWGRLSRSDSATKVNNRFGYAGYMWEPVNKLYNQRKRVELPQVGRWLTRDQLGYIDGMNLYEGVRSAPLKLTDPSGTAAAGPFPGFGACHGGGGVVEMALSCQPSNMNPCAPDPGTGDCCQLAQPCSNGDGGGVICCRGQKVSCSWQPVTGPGSDIIDDCTREHEDDHHDDIPDCSGCPSGQICRPGWAPGADPRQEECKAYKKEIKCLNREVGRCASLPPADRNACYRLVARRLEQICETAYALCGHTPQGCRVPWPD